jgi:hypothetical protein
MSHVQIFLQNFTFTMQNWEYGAQIRKSATEILTLDPLYAST